MSTGSTPLLKNGSSVELPSGFKSNETMYHALSNLPMLRTEQRAAGRNKAGKQATEKEAVGGQPVNHGKKSPYFRLVRTCTTAS